MPNFFGRFDSDGAVGVGVGEHLGALNIDLGCPGRDVLGHLSDSRWRLRTVRHERATIRRHLPQELSS